MKVRAGFRVKLNFRADPKNERYLETVSRLTLKSQIKGWDIFSQNGLTLLIIPILMPGLYDALTDRLPWYSPPRDGLAEQSSFDPSALPNEHWLSGYLNRIVTFEYSIM